MKCNLRKLLFCQGADLTYEEMQTLGERMRETGLTKHYNIIITTKPSQLLTKKEVLRALERIEE